MEIPPLATSSFANVFIILQFISPGNRIIDNNNSDGDENQILIY